MPIEFGLKLWSINADWFPEAVVLHRQGVIQFVELYIVPGQVDIATLETLRPVPIRLHAPNENHGFNPMTLTTDQVRMFKTDVSNTADLVKAKTIVVHAGVGSDMGTFVANIKKLSDSRIIIENMPKVALDGTTCFGHNLRQLQGIQEQLNIKFCLDIGHAIKSAVSQQLDPKEFIQALLGSLHPTYFHISDGDPSNKKDEHLSLGDGTYDFAWIRHQIETVAKSKPVQIVFEVPKNGRDLGNDVANIQRWLAL